MVFIAAKQHQIWTFGDTGFFLEFCSTMALLTKQNNEIIIFNCMMAIILFSMQQNINKLLIASKHVK